MDPVKIKQTLLNLLRNAQDAVSSLQDLRRPSIRLDAEYTDCKLLISITDNGIGIDAADLASAFDLFVTHKPGGTGLGLAIAKRIITAHKGTIHAESTPGTGSSFTISLPVQQDA